MRATPFHAELGKWLGIDPRESRRWFETMVELTKYRLRHGSTVRLPRLGLLRLVRKPPKEGVPNYLKGPKVDAFSVPSRVKIRFTPSRLALKELNRNGTHPE